LERKVIRTIGAAQERFGDDYLRMLRAVRFAARLDLRLKKNWAAICALSGKISDISAERIAAELENILTPRIANAAPNCFVKATLRAYFPCDDTNEMAMGIEILGCLGKRIDWPLGLADFVPAWKHPKPLVLLKTQTQYSTH